MFPGNQMLLVFWFMFEGNITLYSLQVNEKDLAKELYKKYSGVRVLIF